MRSVRTPPPHTFPALRCALLFIGGILCGPLPHAAAALTAALLLAFSVFLRARRGVDPLAPLLSRLFIPSFLIMALGSAKISADRGSVPAIPDSLTIRPVTVMGKVATPPAESQRRVRFLVHADGCFDGVSTFPLGTDLVVTVNGPDAEEGVRGLAAGMSIALRGTLSLPGPVRNPGEFSPAEYMAANGIAGTLVLRGTENVLITDSAHGFWLSRALVAPARKEILRCVDSTIGGEEGEFLKGLLIGDRAGIPPETIRAFVTSGVAHVLAVSGSNVAVVALMLAFLAGLLRLPRRIRTALVAAGLLFYMELTGGQIPVVRATIMALTFLVGSAAQRRANAYNSLGMSAMLILLIDARQLFDAGFQLSFCAVFGIIHLYPRMNAWIVRFQRAIRWRRYAAAVLRLCAVSLAATLGTLPVTAAWFGRVSVIGILANIPVVPATGVSVVLGAAAVAASVLGGWAASAFGALNAVILRWTIDTAHIAAAAPYAAVDASGLPPAATIAFCAVTGLLFHYREPGAVRVFLPALLLSLNVVVFFPAGAGPPFTPGLLRVHVIDVGQGDAILVEFPGGRTMLIDAGPSSPVFDAGERTVLPYLRRRGIARIDLLVVTHPHSDHLGGVPSLLGPVKVERVVDSGQPVRSSLYGSYLRAAAAESVPPETVSAGAMLDAAPEARLYVLAPLPRFVDRDTTHAPPNLNNASVVLRLLYGNVAVLFAGDAEEEAEEMIAAQFGDFLRATLLKSGHHGSSTSSSARFLDAVQPELAAVSAGRRNRFHHPSPAVLQRFASRGIPVARTDLDGAVIVETDGHSLRRVHWR